MRAMSNRRSKFELYREILSQVKNGNYMMTKLMYGSNLSWNSFNQYFEPLVSQGLIRSIRMDENNGSRVKYFITEKGEICLECLGLALNSVKLGDEINL